MANKTITVRPSQRGLFLPFFIKTNDDLTTSWKIQIKHAKKEALFPIKLKKIYNTTEKTNF